MKKHQNRDEMVVATKFTTGFRGSHAPEKLKSNFQGNHAKSLRLSVDASLKKLQTEYIDLLYVHWWDSTTSIPELMNSLHHLVASGKVLYLGISDTPAWLVVKCNDCKQPPSPAPQTHMTPTNLLPKDARFHGLTQFAVYQGQWSAAYRDFEREILPMVESEGMGLAPWGALGRGMFKSSDSYNDPSREGRQAGPQNPKFERVARKLEELAKQKGTAITSVALAYVMHKAPYVYPIVGGRKVEHLKGNIEALGVELSQEEIDGIEDAEPFDVGFPLGFLYGFGGKPYRSRMTTSDIALVTAAARLELVPKVQPVAPRQYQKLYEQD